MKPPDDTESIHLWLRAAGIIDIVQGETFFLAFHSLPLDASLFARFCDRLPPLLSPLSDSLGSFRALQAYVARHLDNAQELTELAADTARLEKLLRAFDLGSVVQNWLIQQDVELSRSSLTANHTDFVKQVESAIEAAVAGDAGRASAAKKVLQIQRSTLIDIAMEQVYGSVSIELSLQRISQLADTIVRWCFERCYQLLIQRFGVPQREDRSLARSALLASLELGGAELNVDTPLQLLLLADCHGKTNAARSISNRQFFERLVHDIDDMLSGPDQRNRLYTIRWTVLPNAFKSMVQDFDGASQYYDTKGRTWERQASIQLRTIAGDQAAGAAFVNSLYPWIYRRYIVEADEAGVGVLTRKILRQLSGREYLRWDDANPYQGVQLISKTVHLLLLTYGHQNDALRTLNTFEAIRSLEQHKKLTAEQSSSLQENLQAFNRLVLESNLDKRPSKEGRFHYRRQRTAKTFEATKNTLFDVLLDEQPAASWPAEESDLIMDPSPPKAWVAHVLRDYNIDDPQATYDLLAQMGEEELFCLSTRQCRHQFAQVAPALLKVVATTPAPLSTLHNLNRIAQCLGGKAVLWQLFLKTPATMKAMVRLSASSPYLTNQLTQSPGMIDELVDSLLLGRLPSHGEVHNTLGKLATSESDLQTIAEFKRAFMLRIGIRHLLNKSDAKETQVALSQVADAIVTKLATNYWNQNDAAKVASIHSRLAGRYAIFAIGRYGARRLIFRDKLPMLLVYRSEDSGSINDSGLMVQHVYDKLGQAILQQLQSTAVGDRMYEAQFRWGPMQGRSQLALSRQDFLSIFQSATIIDKCATRTMRLISGDVGLAELIMTNVAAQWTAHDWSAVTDLLKAARDKMKRRSADDRRSLAIEQRLAEYSEVFILMHAFDKAPQDADEQQHALESKVGELEVAVQLVCKSSATELRKDTEGQRRLAYFLSEKDATAILDRLDEIEQDMIKLLDAFLAGASRPPQMPVAQTGSRDSNLCL